MVASNINKSLIILYSALYIIYYRRIFSGIVIRFFRECDFLMNLKKDDK
jgi:hypothetical protein